MIVDKIAEFLKNKPSTTLEEALSREVGNLAALTFKSKFLENEEYDAKGKIWFSSAGKCARQLAYKFHGIETKGKEFEARAGFLFWMGDLAEAAITTIARAAGCPIVAIGSQQLRAEIKVGDQVVSGRPDGIYIADEVYMVEVKSMPSYRYEAFEKGQIDQSYIDQVNIGMEALNLNKTIFVAFNRDVGILNERIVMKSPERVDWIKANIDTVIKSTPELLPDRPYVPDDKGYYPWQCTYCAARETCLVEPGLAKLTLVKNSYKMKAVEAEVAHK